MHATARKLHVACLPRGSERYVVLWFEDRVDEAIQRILAWAEDPELSFTWQDAARLAQAMRMQGAGHSTGEAIDGMTGLTG